MSYFEADLSDNDENNLQSLTKTYNVLCDLLIKDGLIPYSLTNAKRMNDFAFVEEFLVNGKEDNDVQTISNVISVLLNTVLLCERRIQSDCVSRRDFEIRIQSLRAEIERKESILEKSEKKKDILKRENASQKLKNSESEKVLLKEKSKLVNEKNELLKSLTLLKQKSNASEHTIRKKDKEIGSLKEKLSGILSEKSSNSSNGIQFKLSYPVEKLKNSQSNSDGELLEARLRESYENNISSLETENDTLRQLLISFREDLEMKINPQMKPNEINSDDKFSLLLNMPISETTDSLIELISMKIDELSEKTAAVIISDESESADKKLIMEQQALIDVMAKKLKTMNETSPTVSVRTPKAKPLNAHKPKAFSTVKANMKPSVQRQELRESMFQQNLNSSIDKIHTNELQKMKTKKQSQNAEFLSASYRPKNQSEDESFVRLKKTNESFNGLNSTPLVRLQNLPKRSNQTIENKWEKSRLENPFAIKRNTSYFEEDEDNDPFKKAKL